MLDLVLFNEYLRTRYTRYFFGVGHLEYNGKIDDTQIIERSVDR